MKESEVEKQFVAAVRAVGGQALKFTSQSMNGVPDRLVLLIGGKCAFVELKAPGKQMRILQRKRRLQLEALGFPVFCVDRLEQIQPATHFYTGRRVSLSHRGSGRKSRRCRKLRCRREIHKARSRKHRHRMPGRR